MSENKVCREELLSKVVRLDENFFDDSFHVYNTDEDVADNGWHQVHNFIEENIGENTVEFYHNTERGGYATKRLDGIYVVEERDNWLFISRGFTETSILKVKDDYDTSGLGFELVFRLAKRGGEDEDESQWVANLFATILEYAHNDTIHSEDIVGPLRIEGIPFTEVLLLKDFLWSDTLDTKFGSVEFYQVVLLHSQESEMAIRVGPHLYTKWLFQMCVPCNDVERKPSEPDAIIENIKKLIIPDNDISVEEEGLNQRWFMSRKTCRDILVSMLRFRPYVAKDVVFYPLGGVPTEGHQDLTQIFISGALYRSIVSVIYRVGSFSISEDPDIVLTLSE